MKPPALRRLVQTRVRYLVMVSAMLLIVQPFLYRVGSAEETPPLSPSVVLALKLISTTLVNPVTGIVISDDGKVLVPSDFVMEDGEFVVLDGGTDITSHGRPANVLEGSVTGSLAILEVEGLNKPAITVSESAMQDESLLHFVAFPLAKRIAAGDKPLWVPVRTQRLGPTGPVIASAETPIPNVFGPIMDDCGYLAGLNLGVGLPSMVAGGAPVTLFADQLVQAFESLQINLILAECPVSSATFDVAATVDDQTSVEKETEVGQGVGEFEEQEEAEKTIALDESSIETADRAQIVEPGMPTSPESTPPPSLWRIVPLWLVLLTVVVIAIGIWKITVFLRLHRHPGEDTTRSSGAMITGLASDEPDTAQLKAGDDHSAGSPGESPGADTHMPDINALPDGFNAVLVIEGFMARDVRFKRFCIVNTDNIDIVVGRGKADVGIEHPAISREHIRLAGDGESMTVSDLGSSNGTFIRGIPCLPGEIMYIESKDEILLGEVRFCFHIVGKDLDQG